MSKILKIVPWVIIIVLAGLYYYQKIQNDKLAAPPVYSEKIKETVPIIETYKDKQGNEHVVVKDNQNVITKKEIKNPERPRNTMVDTAAANLKIAVAEIQRVTKIATSMEAQKLRAERKIDELTKKLSFAYADEYVKLKYTPPADTDTLGNGTFDFGYNAELTITQYQKRKWFLGAKQSYIDISSNDKRTTIRGVRQLTIKQQTPQFGLRFQMNGNYNINYKSLGVGPAIRLDLGRFSIQGNYSYYPQSQNWVKSVNANYDILRF